MSYPASNFHFKVEWKGKNVGFSEVSGLTQEVQTIEYRDGNSPIYSSITMPGQVKLSHITLKRGIAKSDNDFFKWLNATKMNNPERRDITISLLNEKHEAIVTWKARNAFPVKVDGGSLNAKGNEVAIETIEIAHEGVTIQND